jgi:hypothetical protein
MQLAAQEDFIVMWDDTCNLYRLFQWSFWHRSFYWEVGARSFEFLGWVGIHTCTVGSIWWKCWRYVLLGWMMCTGRSVMSCYARTSSISLGSLQGSYSCCTDFVVGKKL